MRRDRLGQWQLTLAGDGMYSRTNLPEAAAIWLNDKASTTAYVAGGGRTETQEPGKPLRLLRVVSQAHLPPGTGPVTYATDDSRPLGKRNRIGDGLLIWIDNATHDEVNTFFSQP